MVSPFRPFVIASALLLASFQLGSGAAAQQAPQQAVPAQRPTFCIVNGLEGVPVTAEVKAGKAMTRIQIPPGQNACCIKFCAENPAPSGYQIAMLAQPAGAKQQQVCTATLARGRILHVVGNLAAPRCDEARL